MRQDISENKQLLTLRATIIIVAAYLAFDMVKNYVVGNLSDTHFSEIIYYEFSDIYVFCVACLYILVEKFFNKGVQVGKSTLIYWFVGIAVGLALFYFCNFLIGNFILINYDFGFIVSIVISLIIVIKYGDRITFSILRSMASKN